MLRLSDVPAVPDSMEGLNGSKLEDSLEIVMEFCPFPFDNIGVHPQDLIVDQRILRKDKKIRTILALLSLYKRVRGRRQKSRPPVPAYFEL